MKKEIGKFDIIALAVGAIIGWGAFVLPGDFFLKEIGLLNSTIGLFIGALVIIVIEKNYEYMIIKYPVSGGEFIYIYKIFGKKLSFIVGWFLILAYVSIVPLNATALSLVVNKLFNGILEIGYLYSISGYKIFLGEIILSSLFLIIFAFINIKGIKLAAKFQKIIVFLLVIIVVFFYLYAFLNKSIDKTILFTELKIEKINYNLIMKVIAISPWAYLGFDTIPQIIDEIKISEKKISILSVFSIFLGFIIYSLLNFLTALKFNQIILITKTVNWATGETVEALFGEIGLMVLGIALFSAIIAGINGFYIASSKLIYSMAEAKALPEYFISKGKNSKANSIFFIMSLSLIAPWIGRKVLGWIVDMSSLGAALAYGFTCLGVYKISKGSIKYQILGILGAILSLIFICLLIFPGFGSSLSKESYLFLLAWVLLGFKFYKDIYYSFIKEDSKTIDKIIFQNARKEVEINGK